MIYVSTHAGKRHSISEDSVLVGTQVLAETSGTFSVPCHGFVCVADGVGGNSGGAEASRFVLSALSKMESIDRECIDAFLSKLNISIIETAVESSLADMATTLTGFFFSDGLPTLIHVGNTRAFIKQGKYLKQITSDHTTYNWLMSSGQYDAAEICNKSEITNCFGGNDPSLLSKLCVSSIPLFSLAVLTSDGIHDYVDLDAFEEVIAGDSSYRDKCEELVRRAVEAGSEDDLSIVIICPCNDERTDY